MKTKSKLGIAISLIAIAVIMTAANVSLPAIYAKHKHLTDTEKEDSSATDAQGRPCDFGPDHDQCKVQFEQSQETTCHFGPNHDECFKEAWENDS